MFNHIPFLCLHLSISKSIFSNHSSDLMTDDTFFAHKTDFTILFTSKFLEAWTVRTTKDFQIHRE